MFAALYDKFFTRRSDGFHRSVSQTLRSRSTEYQVNLLQRFSKEALPKVMQGHYELVLHKVRSNLLGEVRRYR